MRPTTTSAVSSLFLLVFCVKHVAVAFAPRTITFVTSKHQAVWNHARIVHASSSTTAAADESSSDSPSSSSFLQEKNGSSNENDSTRMIMDLPWTDIQEYALRDALPRYTLPGQPSFALWRTMTKDVTELCGYPIDYLQTKITETETIPIVLPLLDDFEFHVNGGVCGLVYGMEGVADGTLITTPTLSNVHTTVPRGYVQTKSSSSMLAYELGTPKQQQDANHNYSLLQNGSSSSNTRKTAAATTLSLLSTNENVLDNDTTELLSKVGASTALLLGSAAMVGMLSHHLTVHVFWV